MKFYSSFRQFSALKFETKSQAKVIHISKDKHVKFAGAYNELKAK